MKWIMNRISIFGEQSPVRTYARGQSTCADLCTWALGKLSGKVKKIITRKSFIVDQENAAIYTKALLLLFV